MSDTKEFLLQVGIFVTVILLLLLPALTFYKMQKPKELHPSFREMEFTQIGQSKSWGPDASMEIHAVREDGEEIGRIVVVYQDKKILTSYRLTP